MRSKRTKENATIIRAISQGNNARHFARAALSPPKVRQKKRELYLYIVQSENSIYYENYSWNSLRLVQNKHITAISNRGGEDSFKHFSNL